MAKKKLSKMSAKARMAYVRSFIGKKKGKRGGSLKEQMDYVRSFRGKKKKSGGKFPKGSLSVWKAKAKTGSALERAKYKRAIANWNKLMSKSSFKSKWGVKKGGALEDNVNYSDLIHAYQDRSYGMGGAIRAGAIRGAAIRGAAIRGAAIRGAGGLRGVRSEMAPRLSPSMAKKFEQIYKRHVRQGAGITKRDLYRGAGKQNSLFYTRNRILQRQKKKPMTITTPDDEMIQAYRNLYKNSGIRAENMIDPIVRNDRLKGAGIFKKIGKAVAAPVKFVKKHKLASAVGSFIPGPAGVAVRTGAKILGAGLIEEAGLNGRGHPPYIYH